MSGVVSKSIFDDLELDYGDMTTNPDAFTKRVMAKVDELNAILAADTSVSAFEAKIKANTKGYTLSDDADSFVMFIREELYEYADTAPLEEVAIILENLRESVKEMETLFRSRSVYEASSDNSPMSNKKLALHYHQRLRETWDVYRKFVAAFFTVKTAKGEETPKLLPSIKPKSGNFATGLNPFRSYAYTLNGETYMNHFAVMRKLGIHKDGATLMDLQEYLEANPDCGVDVTQVQF